MSDVTREGWLQLMTAYLRAHFETAGFFLPETVHVSVGFPSTRGRAPIGKRTIGECWGPEASTDGAPHIFISPLINSPEEVTETLVHELLHIVVGVEHGHRAAFKVAMGKIGLEGKPTATVAGPELKEILRILLLQMPPWPHPAIVLGELKQKKQTTRMLLCQADHEYVDEEGHRQVCDYSVRTTQKHIAKGLPRCPHGKVMQRADKRKGEDEGLDEELAA
jgi:hypothetical protein